MPSSKIKIALGDLRCQFKHSFFMPIGVGYLATYTQAQLGPEAVEIRVYDQPEVLLKEVGEWRPHLIGLSNYCWNTELSMLVFRHAQKLAPGIITVAGGPEFHADLEERRLYLTQHPELDFFVYLEGEVAFSDLVRRLWEGADRFQLKAQVQGGIVSLHPETGEIMPGEPLPRLTNLDVIPSPYLTGLFDDRFNGQYAPAIETTRGCPFTCAYCVAGNPWFNTISHFSTARTKDELTYIAQRISRYPEVMLGIWDNNFGMYKRDLEIAEHLGLLQDEFGWPNSIQVGTGKRNFDQILPIWSILKNCMALTTSVQSLNPKTLEVIKRKNLPLPQFKETQQEIKKRGIISQTEFIVPLPEETKESFFAGLRTVIDAGAEYIIPYTTMVLKQTPLASQEFRQKYAMQSKFRIVPRQFGEYQGEKFFEIEEVCVATNTLSFEDYLECRGFAFVTVIFSSELFDFAIRHIKEIGLVFFDSLMYLGDQLKSGDSGTSRIYNRYSEETRKELWDSREQIYAYFQQPKNYQKLLRGELGDNLIRKYKAQIIIDALAEGINLIYDSLEKLGGELITPKIRQSLESARRWMIAVRDSLSVFKNRDLLQKVEILELPFDVCSWYNQKTDPQPLTAFDRPVRYKIYYDQDKMKNFLETADTIFGQDSYYQIGKLLAYLSVKKLWRVCEIIQ